MKGFVSGQVRNYIVYFIFFFSLTIIAITYHIGNKQDAIYLQDYKEYAEAYEALENKEGEKAIQLLSSLTEKHADSFIVFWNYGQALKLTSDYGLAAKQYEKALKIRPALVERPDFMVEFGEVLYRNQDYQMAEVYLEAAQKLELSDDLSNKVNTILQKISVYIK